MSHKSYIFDAETIVKVTKDALEKSRGKILVEIIS